MKIIPSFHIKIVSDMIDRCIRKTIFAENEQTNSFHRGGGHNIRFPHVYDLNI